MKKNVKKILSVGLTLALTITNGGLWCLAAETNENTVSSVACDMKSADKVDNTAISLIWALTKKAAIAIPGAIFLLVDWAWRATLRIPGALWEFLSGYKSDKIHELSAENLELNGNEKLLTKNNTKLASDLQKSQAKLEELQKMINLCNKNKTCKALLNDLLKNGR